MLILWPIWSLVAIVSLSCVGQPAVRGWVYKVGTQSSCMDYWVLLFLKETDTSCSFSVLSYKTMCIFHSFTVAVSFQFRVTPIPAPHLLVLLQVWALQAAVLRYELGSLGKGCRGDWWPQISPSGCCLYCCWLCVAHGFDLWKVRTSTHGDHWDNTTGKMYRYIRLKLEPNISLFNDYSLLIKMEMNTN